MHYIYIYISIFIVLDTRSCSEASAKEHWLPPGQAPKLRRHRHAAGHPLDLRVDPDATAAARVVGPLGCKRAPGFQSGGSKSGLCQRM